jgi:hypothetical protein
MKRDKVLAFNVDICAGPRMWSSRSLRRSTGSLKSEWDGNQSPRGSMAFIAIGSFIVAGYGLYASSSLCKSMGCMIYRCTFGDDAA